MSHSTGNESSAYTLQREQYVPQPIQKVFAFFSDPRNLEKLTPTWLSFQVLTPGPTIFAGIQFHYRLRWHGLPMRWTTEIIEWNPPHGFVDIELSGPYRSWHHTHRFEEVDGGTRMTDVVKYSLPFGVIGRLVHWVNVKRDVERIFEYRREKIRTLFG